MSSLPVRARTGGWVRALSFARAATRLYDHPAIIEGFGKITCYLGEARRAIGAGPCRTGEGDGLAAVRLTFSAMGLIMWDKVALSLPHSFSFLPPSLPTFP